MATLGDLIVNVGADTTGLEASLDSAGRQLETFGKQAEQIGTTLTKRVSLPMAGAGAISGKMAADFEGSMTKLSSLVGLSREAVQGLNEDVLNMAGDVGKAPQELAEGMFFVQSAGLRGQRALNALRASAKASAAGLGSTRDVANAATSAMNAYGEGNLSAAQAVATLVSTVREGKVETSGLAQVIGQIVPISAQLGVEFNEVGASLAAMTRLGLDASKSATALRGIFRGLLKPSKQARETLQEYNMSVAGLRRQVREEGIISALLDLKQAFDGNQDALTAVFPRVRGLIGVLSLVGKNADQAQNIFKSLANTTRADLDKAFETASQTAEFKFARALSRVQSALIRLGNVILPIVIPLIDSLSGIVERAGEIFAGFPKWVQQVIVAVGAFVTILGPALIVIGNLAMLLGSVGVSAVSLLTPLGILAALVVAALIPAFMSLWNNQKTVWENLVNIWKMAKNAAAVVWSGLLVVAKTVFNLLKRFWQRWGSTIKGFFFSIVGFFRRWGDTILGTLESVFSAIVGAFGMLAGAWNSLPESAQRLAIVIATVLVPALFVLAPALSAIFSILAPLLTAMSVASAIFGNGSMAVAAFGIAAGQVGGPLGILLSLVAAGINLFSRFKGILALVAAVITSPITGAVALGAALGALIGLAWVFRDEIVAAFKSMWEGIKKWVSETLDQLKNRFLRGWKRTKKMLVGNSIVPDMATQLKDVLGDMRGDLDSFSNDTLEGFVQDWNNFPDRLNDPEFAERLNLGEQFQGTLSKVADRVGKGLAEDMSFVNADFWKGADKMKRTISSVQSDVKGMQRRGFRLGGEALKPEKFPAGGFRLAGEMVDPNNKNGAGGGLASRPGGSSPGIGAQKQPIDLEFNLDGRTLTQEVIERMPGEKGKIKLS